MEVGRARRLPVLKRTRANSPIPEALKRVSEWAESVKMAPRIWGENRFWPTYA